MEAYKIVSDMIISDLLPRPEQDALRHVLGMINSLADELAGYTGRCVPETIERHSGRVAEIQERNRISRIR